MRWLTHLFAVVAAFLDDLCRVVCSMPFGFVYVLVIPANGRGTTCLAVVTWSARASHEHLCDLRCPNVEVRGWGFCWVRTVGLGLARQVVHTISSGVGLASKSAARRWRADLCVRFDSSVFVLDRISVVSHCGCLSGSLSISGM